MLPAHRDARAVLPPAYVVPPPRIRDRRAAALAVTLAVLGGLVITLGLTTEDAMPAPTALTAAAPPVSSTGPPSAGPPSAGATPAAVKQNPVEPGAVKPSPPRPTVAKPSPAKPAGMRASAPVRLQIPAIGVDTAVMPLGLRKDGTLEVPPLRGDAPAGWYRHSPTPGEVGASVLVGHVDSARDGRAVFFRLREVEVGDPVSVRRTDGSVARFRVVRVAVYPKDEFPSTEVYAPLNRPGLRLITCGGVFDRGEGSYRSNVVVFADPVT